MKQEEYEEPEHILNFDEPPSTSNEMIMTGGLSMAISGGGGRLIIC